MNSDILYSDNLDTYTWIAETLDTDTLDSNFCESDTVEFDTLGSIRLDSYKMYTLESTKL